MYKLNRVKALAAASVAALLSLGSNIAGATGTVGEAPAIRVSYGDLDLGTQAGTAMLYQRIAAAAREVCPREYNQGLYALASSKSCQQRAIEQAVNGIHNSQLAAVHSERVRKR